MTPQNSATQNYPCRLASLYQLDLTGYQNVGSVVLLQCCKNKVNAWEFSYTEAVSPCSDQSR